MFPAIALVALVAADPSPRTLRLDYVHAGNASQEHFALDGIACEGAWPGRPDRPLDDTNLGGDLFGGIDARTNRTLFSRGFASLYAEWSTTAEAQHVERAFHESLRFPEPAGPIQVLLKRRDARGLFRELWSVGVDPADRAIDRTPPAGRPWAVVESGPRADKVDLLLLGDGYTAAEMSKWHADARRLAEMLFAVPPFKERKHDFNVWALDTPSDETGIARPSEGVQRRSALRTSYDAFGSERYVLTFDNKRVREAAAAAPYDVLEIVVNGRTYGGGGVFNQYATVAADNAFTPYVFVHEFAHHFAGLADEYYTSDVAYASSGSRSEPWEVNVTADPLSPKWLDLIASGTPLPTPWPKQEFEAMQREIQARRRKIRAERRPEQEMEALFREEQAGVEALLSRGPHAAAVGAFEGAMYESQGYYRAQANCIMFTRHASFCTACRRGIERVIDLLSRPAL